jgi:hypothetical protein
MMFSERFGMPVHLTHHVKDRMKKRDVDLELLENLIETGEITWKDGQHAWIHKSYPERNDNLVCAAVAIRDVVVVKTVMIHWVLEGKS